MPPSARSSTAAEAPRLERSEDPGWRAIRCGHSVLLYRDANSLKVNRSVATGGTWSGMTEPPADRDRITFDSYQLGGCGEARAGTCWPFPESVAVAGPLADCGERAHPGALFLDGSGDPASSRNHRERCWTSTDRNGSKIVRYTHPGKIDMLAREDA